MTALADANVNSTESNMSSCLLRLGDNASTNYVKVHEFSALCDLSIAKYLHDGFCWIWPIFTKVIWIATIVIVIVIQLSLASPGILELWKFD